MFGFRGVGRAWCGVSGYRDMFETVRVVCASLQVGFKTASKKIKINKTLPLELTIKSHFLKMGLASSLGRRWDLKPETVVRAPSPQSAEEREKESAFTEVTAR